ncbi:MAG: hypothetical protein UT32_C0004G0008 [Parcubacteria group bacterium GW2011_GWC2_39_14]|nr:MAG: hypothetical protein UT32_C0004G0008 [Parcubacteria group bacterium GW2011_GWC2_39_14]KKR54852.1 MAG: hypothetical protein UT91_C0008G0008 [Parcubacteria group bacterium GW2011_GWA2_40_23]
MTIEQVPTIQPEGTTGVREKGLLKVVNFDPEKCKCNLGKAQKLQPKDGEMVLDTGDFEVTGTGDCYVETIKTGVVDHHRLDNMFRVRGQVLDPRCSAKIIVTYVDDVSRMIEARGVHTTLAHADGDLDSIVSSYLIQSLIQRKELPVGAMKLAEHVNKVDYGMYREADIEKYLASLSGIFSAIKSDLASARDGELGKEVFGNPEMKAPNGRLNDAGVQRLNEIKTKYENLLAERMFQVLNETENAAVANSEFDPEKDMDAHVINLAPEVQESIERGKVLTRKELEVFNQDFEQAERTTIKIKVPKTGETIEVPVIIALEPKTVPTAFTNIAYQRITPDTIVAVYGGANRKGGDMYDIGIKQESAALLDIGELCVALNRAEKEKRDQLAVDDPIRTALESQPDRLGMSGPEQILTKDPTVLVAGGTLIAATRSSLLSAKDFNSIIKSLQK